MSNERYEIKISFLGRVFPLIVNEEEEQRIKKAVKLIEDKLQELKEVYSITDEVSLAMMCSLEIATAHVMALENYEKYKEEMKETLKSLEDTSNIEEEDIEELKESNFVIPESE